MTYSLVEVRIPLLYVPVCDALQVCLCFADKWCSFANFCLNFKYDYVIIPVMFYFIEKNKEVVGT